MDKSSKGRNHRGSRRDDDRRGGRDSRRTPRRAPVAPRRDDDADSEDNEFVWGRHAVAEALTSGSAATINKLFVQKSLSSDQIHSIVERAKKAKILVSEVPKSKLDLLSDNGNHQGVMLAMPPYAYASIDDLFAKAQAAEQDPFFLILDNLEDPRNLGAIMRTADAVGVHGIIIPKHRAVGLTSAVAKISTGAIEHVPVARVTNLANAIKALKDRGLWIFGTAMEGQDFRQWNATGPIGLVIGNEGKGISPGIQKLMDATVSIPMVGHVQSLNASVAAGILMYQAFTSRQAAQQ
ncbi:23S rRNA (guanosine(2251)-2'-O)-methyltransferase RlmB [Lacticaseibacillus thailandensis]|uniref:TrmH family tRNA rRNA methyltransferase n=1 Tax=Lacticaseibacillus thailandensis DSM 22698 = JCM 13996 TaxID=1423810 RepID=A0A0R2C6B5_9LACO|nr:23S rRNA (guanosine(2251)-2'-O)-methyltransferase RlmB [Lacticaseibacillus thailandensis]KRM86482.1 TrmH family tRNA rRNA methyltransferase [Lacticaseibacillus thailandensis DSM 22698 = JCM 13996]